MPNSKMTLERQDCSTGELHSYLVGVDSWKHCLRSDFQTDPSDQGHKGQSSPSIGRRKNGGNVHVRIACERTLRVNVHSGHW